MRETIKDDNNPLNSLMFGVGQPLKVYWENANFNRCRFDGYSSNFLFWLRLGFFVPHVFWTKFNIDSNNGEYMNFFYYWSSWGWVNAIFAQALTLLAAWKPEYWHVMAFAWTEFSHCLNLGITFAFWLILVPAIWQYIPEGFPSTDEDYFIILHMSIVHLSPLIMIWVNIYFTDIKILSADWKLMVWHGVFYAFANWLGQFDHDIAIYPMTDW